MQEDFFNCSFIHQFWRVTSSNHVNSPLNLGLSLDFSCFLFRKKTHVILAKTLDLLIIFLDIHWMPDQWSRFPLPSMVACKAWRPLLGPLLGPPMAAMGLQLFQHAKVTLIPKHDSWLMVWNMFSWLIYG